MIRLNWPTAIALVFAALPAFVFAVVVCAVYRAVGVPLLLGLATAVWAARRQSHRAALATRAAVDCRRNAAIGAADPRAITSLGYAVNGAADVDSLAMP